MKDLVELLAAARHDDTGAEFSLTYRLEHIVGGYFVQGEGVGAPMPWLTVYYDASFEYNDYNSMIALVPENIAAYIHSGLRIAFVRAEHLARFQSDARGYGLAFVPLESFEEETLCCRAPERLPEALRGVAWLENRPAVGAAGIIGGNAAQGRRLDPARFSLESLARWMNERM